MGERTDGDRLFEEYLRHAGVPVPDMSPISGSACASSTCSTSTASGARPRSRSSTRSSWPIKAGDHLDGAGPQATSHADSPRSSEAARGERPRAPARRRSHRSEERAVRTAASVRDHHGDDGRPAGANPGVGQRPRWSCGLGAGRNGELRNNHPYVSAVVHIDHAADHPRARTVITGSPHAVPLSPVFFRGPDDLVWEYSDEASAYLPVDDPHAPPGQGVG